MINIKINEDIEIKLIKVEDAEALFDFVDRNRNHLKKWLNWVNTVQTINDEIKHLKTLSQDIYTSKSIDFGIWYDNKIIGTISLTNVDRINKIANLEYRLDENYQHKGIITECSKVLIDFAFKKLLLHRIELKILKENFRSKAVGERLDFEFEGVMRESYYLDGKFLDFELFSKLAL